PHPPIVRVNSRIPRTIPPTEWIAQPWRNGTGVTREIARWPATGEYDIRASIADVTTDGPFSTFPGYRRWSVLLGAPIELDGHRLLELGDMLEVDGDTP